MTTIGTIGAGHIGSTVARLAAASGHQVILSNSRGPQTLTDLANDIGDGVRAGTQEQAAQADVVVVTVPLKALDAIPADLLDGKIVIDTMNYYPDRDGDIPDLKSGRTTTSEMAAAHFHGARIVKGFNNIIYRHLQDLARPAGDPDRSTLAIAGDDEAAKHTVSQLIGELGYDTLDAGPLREGWRFQNGEPAYCAPYFADPDGMSTGNPDAHPSGSRQVTAADLQGWLDKATR